VLQADTEYATGFSEAGFAAISSGMSRDEVRRLAGPPLEQWWNYSTSPDHCRLLRIVDDVVSRWDDYEACTPTTVQEGTTAEEARRLLGPPHDEIWRYSRSRGGARFHVHTVFFFRGVVEEVMKRWTSMLPE
jgi:hypothetical protein